MTLPGKTYKADSWDLKWFLISNARRVDHVIASTVHFFVEIHKRTSHVYKHFRKMKLVVFFIGTCLSLKIYRSNLSIGKSGLSGLKYIHSNQNVMSTNSLTVCGRFNYKRLGTKSVIFDLDNNLATSYLSLSMGYPYSFINFGNYDENHIATTSNLLTNPKTDEFIIWYINKWHHICFSYSKSNSFVSFVKVRYNARPNQIELLKNSPLNHGRYSIISFRGAIFVL